MPTFRDYLVFTKTLRKSELHKKLFRNYFNTPFLSFITSRDWNLVHMAKPRIHED